ncbi:hypothetical protein Cgig2_021863 [Carnegiea gigantea]|uniref:Uncharacterized protein n=1 Tax=Carnegiea gigantea TaxID=171969 RepID=A0A9Q1GP81_9CARY|nr:hypothetical protein Cgig2_021863 [Carnegiea gigantea]
MVTCPSNQTQGSKGKAIDMDEHVGDSDEANEDGSDADIECLGVEESRSPPKSVHNSRKQKSEGETSSDGKQMDEKDCTMDEEDCTMDEEEDHAIDTIIGYTLQRYHHIHGEGFIERVVLLKQLCILAREESYREAEVRFQHYPSTIGKYHKQVLDGLVQLSASIVRLYQSQDELAIEILQKKGFYWPFFRVWSLPPHTL